MIELSLHESYCPSWGQWEGIRDLVQNHQDGVDRGFTGEISLRGEKLVLVNKGVTLAREKLLIGFSDKRGDAS